MLVLRRRYQFWFSMIALHKIGAVAVPATDQLMEKILFTAMKLPMSRRSSAHRMGKHTKERKAP